MYLSSLSELSKLNSTVAKLIVDLITKRQDSRFMEFSLTALFEHAAGIQIPSKSKNREKTIRNAVDSLWGYKLIEKVDSGKYRIVVNGLLDLQVQQEKAYQEMDASNASCLSTSNTSSHLS